MSRIITNLHNYQEFFPYTFYETLCLVNGKHYRGVHKEEPGEYSQKYLGSGIKLNEAIEKYGRDKFVKRNIKRFKTEKEAYEYEKKWVNHKDPMSYNQCPGGKKPPTKYGDDNPSKRPEVRAKLSAARVGNQTNLGKGRDYLVISPENHWYYVQKPTEWAQEHFPNKWIHARSAMIDTASGRQKTFMGGWRVVIV